MRLSLDLGLGSVATLNAGVGAASLVSQYREIALRASQAGFGSPVDQSGNYNDPQINTALFPPTWQASQTVAASAYRSPTTPNGYLYKATAGGGGATGTGEPTWPTTIGGTVADGAITWTCERGPWFTAASGQLHIASIKQSLLPASGAYTMPSIDWNMADGDSLVLSFRLAFNGTTEIRTDTSGSVMGNRHSGTARSGLTVIFDTGSFNNFRFAVGDGTNSKVSGFVATSFTRKPLDGASRSVVMMIDGPTETMYVWIDGIALTQADMVDGSNVCPNGMDLSTVTGSTATTNNFMLGAVPGGNSYDFGVTALDLMVLPSRGLGSEAARQALADYLVALA